MDTNKRVLTTGKIITKELLDDCIDYVTFIFENHKSDNIYDEVYKEPIPNTKRWRKETKKFFR